MMPPIAAEPDGAKYIITHQCETCGKIKRQKTSDNDNIDAIIELSKNNSFIYGGR